MNLREARVLFTKNLPMLIITAEALGYEVAADFLKRCIDCPVGHARSCHKSGLAIDLHLYKDGIYLSDDESHQPLGEWWEAQHPLFRWGGRFGDGNHYSLEWEGVK